MSLAGRDIGELPAVVNPERKARAAPTFASSAKRISRFTFHLAWSPDHLKVIAKIEQAVLRGGLFAMAMPRGSRQDDDLRDGLHLGGALRPSRLRVPDRQRRRARDATCWNRSRRNWTATICLLEDFPEVCFPIQCLDGIANRCSGQLYKGERTHIGWTAKEIVLPTIAGSLASGAIIKVAGITGRIRGMKYKRADGQLGPPVAGGARRSADRRVGPQRSRSAPRERASWPARCWAWPGPGKKIAGVMPCTVIRPGDMADNILDRDKHPEWNGERTKMVYSLPHQ